METKSQPLRLLACKDRRDLPLDLVDVKLLKGAGEAITFTGYGSVWGRVDSYGDTVLKGAFKDALAERRPMMLYGHSPGRVPGKWIKYEEDDKGLLMTGELTPGHSEATDIAASLKHGSLNGLSIGGYTQEWEAQKDGGRVIKTFDLYEVSVVSMPAEQEARIDTASVKEALQTYSKLSQFEDFLRDVGGLSKTAAQALVSRFRTIARSESAADGTEGKAAEEFLRAIQGLEIPDSLLKG